MMYGGLHVFGKHEVREGGLRKEDRFGGKEGTFIVEELIE